MLATLVVVDVFVDGHVDGVGFGDGNFDFLFYFNGVGLLYFIWDGFLHGVGYGLLHNLGYNL